MVVPGVIVCACATGGWVAGGGVTGGCVTGGREPEVGGRWFPAVFPGTPLESGYEQWNCESGLCRVAVDLLPHFPLLNCAVGRD